MRNLAALIFLTCLVGCATQTLERRDFKSYSVGQTLRAAPGAPLLTVQGGSVEKVRRWVGLLNAPDGWRVDSQYSSDYVRKELIYGGVSGTTVEISYREYRGGLAAPAFFQSLKYDLKESAFVTFQNFHFEVLNATNSGISARLLSDSGVPVRINSAADVPTQAAMPASADPSTNRSANQPTGTDSVVAERYARSLSCTRDVYATLIGKGPGYENYSFKCLNGETLVVRCEMGNCRALK